MIFLMTITKVLATFFVDSVDIITTSTNQIQPLNLPKDRMKEADLKKQILKEEESAAKIAVLFQECISIVLQRSLSEDSLFIKTMQSLIRSMPE